MSMTCSMLGVTPAQIGALRAQPSLVGNVVLVVRDDQQQALIDDLIKRMPSERRPEFDANRARFEASPVATEIQARLADARSAVAALGAIESALDLQKSWHMLHYLFTGHEGPANAPGDLLLAGEAVGEDLGYGPARLHNEIQTREFSRFLEGQDLARLQARVDLKEMTLAGVYGMPCGQGSDAEVADYEQELRDEVGFYFPQFRDYVRKMADQGNGLLVWIS